MARRRRNGHSTIRRLLSDVVTLIRLALTPRARLAAENLFLRKQLALYPSVASSRDGPTPRREPSFGVEPRPRQPLRICLKPMCAYGYHQGLGNECIAPTTTSIGTGPIRCRERLGGVLKFYYRAAA